MPHLQFPLPLVAEVPVPETRDRRGVGRTDVRLRCRGVLAQPLRRVGQGAVEGVAAGGVDLGRELAAGLEVLHPDHGLVRAVREHDLHPLAGAVHVPALVYWDPGAVPARHEARVVHVGGRAAGVECADRGRYVARAVEQHPHRGGRGQAQNVRCGRRADAFEVPIFEV